MPTPPFSHICEGWHQPWWIRQRSCRVPHLLAITPPFNLCTVYSRPLITFSGQPISTQAEEPSSSLPQFLDGQSFKADCPSSASDFFCWCTWWLHHEHTCCWMHACENVMKRIASGWCIVSSIFTLPQNRQQVTKFKSKFVKLHMDTNWSSSANCFFFGC